MKYTQNGNVIDNISGFMDGVVWRPFKEIHNLTTEDKILLNISEVLTDKEYTLEEVIKNKRSEITLSRISADNATFIHDGKEFSADGDSKSKIEAITAYIGVTSTLPPNWVGGWKANDNTFYSITTVNEWILFFGSMVSQGQSNFIKSETLKAQIAAIENDINKSDEVKKTEIKAISW